MNLKNEHIVAGSLQLPQMASWPVDLPRATRHFGLHARNGSFNLTPQRLRAIADGNTVVSLTGFKGRVLLVGGDVPGAYKIPVTTTARLSLEHLGLAKESTASKVRGELNIGEGFGVLELRRPRRRGRKPNALKVSTGDSSTTENVGDSLAMAESGLKKKSKNQGIRRKAVVIPSSRPLPFYGTPLAWTDVFVPFEVTTSVLAKSLPAGLLAAAGLACGSLLECQFDGEALSFSPALESSRTAWRVGHRGKIQTHFQIYEAIAKLADRTHAEVVRVIAVAGGLYVTPVSSRVARLCLPRKQVVSDLVPKFTRKADEPEFSIGERSADGKAPRLSGHWLRSLGFHPGASFNVVPHPKFPNKALLAPDPTGPFTVFTSSPRVPEVVCPSSILEKFPSKHVRLAVKDGELVAQAHVTAPLAVAA